MFTRWLGIGLRTRGGTSGSLSSVESQPLIQSQVVVQQSLHLARSLLLLSLELTAV